MNPPGITVFDWKSHSSGTLVGFFSVSLPSGLELHELMLHHRDSSWWLSFPAKPLLGTDGAALRDDSGKVRYSSPLVSFANRQARDRFTEQVLAAFRLGQPQVFAEERAPA